MNVPVDNGTVAQSPTVRSPALFAHAFGTDGVTFPIDPPNDGPGHAVTPGGVHDCVTGATSSRDAIHVDAQVSNNASDAEETCTPELSISFGSNRNEFAESGPEL